MQGSMDIYEFFLGGVVRSIAKGAGDVDVDAHSQVM